MSNEIDRVPRLRISPTARCAVTATFVAVCALVLRLLRLTWALGGSPALAEPNRGETTGEYLSYHKDDPGAWSVAVDLYAQAHNSAVGERQTGHDCYHAQKAVGAGSNKYSTPGSTASGDAIFDYRHKTGDATPVWDEVGGRYETSPCGYGYRNSAQLGCVSCHVAHGTTAEMTPYVAAMPRPGEGGGHFDTLDDGTALSEGWFPEDPNLNAGNEIDHDGDARCNLVRIDNRGGCQNPSCHPEGKTSYLDPFFDGEGGGSPRFSPLPLILSVGQSDVEVP